MATSVFYCDHCCVQHASEDDLDACCRCEECGWFVEECECTVSDQDTTGTDMIDEIDAVIEDKWLESKDDDDLLEKIVDALRDKYTITDDLIATIRRHMLENLMSVDE